MAPDGSVWFGEQAVPALAHFYATNGTLVEYTLPGAYPVNSAPGFSCADKTDIWGVASWDGRVWASDSAQNRLVGLSPENATFRVVSLEKSDSGPYTLTPGPGNTLWFTQIGSGQIGTLFGNGTVAENSVHVPEYLNDTPTPVEVQGVPAQIAFANSSVGYYVDASPLINGSPLFEFNPQHFSPQRIGAANLTLSDPDSLSLGDGGIWLAQHADSSLAFYDTSGHAWAVYPTSTVPYIGTTLPYFVETNGSSVWFNEHYGNRIAVLDPSTRSLTEYSVSDPQASNMSQLANVLTFAAGGGGRGSPRRLETQSALWMLHTNPRSPYPRTTRASPSSPDRAPRSRSSSRRTPQPRSPSGSRLQGLGPRGQGASPSIQVRGRCHLSEAAAWW